MRYVITHGHIFKNAGTTFDSALKKTFGRGFYDHRDDEAMRRGGAEYLKQFILENPELKAISSHHLCNPLPVSDEFQCIPVYFIRHPLERIISVYNFERKQKAGTKGAEMASKLTLLDYVKWRLEADTPKTISDYQTAYLGGGVGLRPDRRVSVDYFCNALKVIESQNAKVGVVERFDESFKVIAAHINKYFPDVQLAFKNKNVMNQGSFKDKCDNALSELHAVLPEIIECNAYDIALHRAANEKLNVALSSMTRK